MGKRPKKSREEEARETARLLRIKLRAATKSVEAAQASRKLPSNWRNISICSPR